MNENKVIKLNIDLKNAKEKTKENKKSWFSFQTNPIIKKMLLTNLENKKDKFKFQDIFK